MIKSRLLRMLRILAIGGGAYWFVSTDFFCYVYTLAGQLVFQDFIFCVTLGFAISVWHSDS